MNPILVTVTVDAFDHFLETFRTRGLELRRRHGCRGARVLRHVEDEQRVTLVFDWEKDAFAAFLADPDVQDSMRAGGTVGPPQIVVCEPAVELEA